MANTINWGKIYCSTEFGDIANEATIHIDSQPTCFE